MQTKGGERGGSGKRKRMGGRYRLRIASRTDTGKRRKVNEDAVAVSVHHGVCVVCDGMGGHASGEVASRMAAETIVAALERTLAPFTERSGAGRGQMPSAELESALREAIATANEAVYERGRNDPEIERGRPMGTTVAVLVLRGAGALRAHIGDSRIYRIRDGTIELLTEDHSVTTSERERRRGKKRKYVTRALGTRPQVQAELGCEPVFAGDRFVLCSDGLTDCVRDDEILAALERAASEQEAVDALVDLANARGGHDNISVVIATLEPTASSARVRPVVELPAASAREPEIEEAIADRPPALLVPPAYADELEGDLTLSDLGLEEIEFEPPPPPLEPPVDQQGEEESLH